MTARRLNVLVVSINRHRNPVCVMPFGACIAAEAAANAGHDVTFLDFMFEERPLRALARRIERTSPDVVGISLRNIDNHDMKNPVAFYRELLPTVATIRRKSAATVVLGGAALGVMPEELLRFSGADFAVTGAGESAFPRLLDALASVTGFEDIPGLAWPEGSGIRINQPGSRPAAHAPFTPDFSRWVDAGRYRRHLTAAPLQTKRGCPYRCVYCTYSVSEGRSYSLAPPERVVESVRRLLAMGFRDIEFVDNVFNSPYEHASAVCEAIIRSRIRARFHTVELNPRFVDGALLALMKRAGFASIGITAESAAGRVLEGLGKNFSPDDVRRAASAVAVARIPCFWIFLLGGPGETEETVAETFRFARRSVRAGDVAFFNVGLRIYPGTGIERRARAEAGLSLSAREMLEPVYYVSPAVEPSGLLCRLKGFSVSAMNCIGSDSLGLPFLPFVYRAASRLGVTPPVWKHTAGLRRSLRLLGADV